MSSDQLAALCLGGVVALLMTAMAAGLRGAARDSRKKYGPPAWDWDRPRQAENEEKKPAPF